MEKKTSSHSDDKEERKDTRKAPATGTVDDGGGRKGAGPITGRQIRYKTSFKNTILDLFKQRGWQEAET